MPARSLTVITSTEFGDEIDAAKALTIPALGGRERRGPAVHFAMALTLPGSAVAGGQHRAQPRVVLGEVVAHELEPADDRAQRDGAVGIDRELLVSEAGHRATRGGD